MTAVDLRSAFPDVRNQRGLNCCVSMALADAIAFDMARQHASGKSVRPFSPSALFIHYHARKAKGHEHHNVGVEPESALAAIAARGICPDWMFSDEAADHRVCPPQNASEFADRFSKPAFERLPLDRERLLESLCRGSPFFFCLRLCATNAREFRFGETARTGEIARADTTEEAVLNHAMLCVGHDPVADQFILRNSLGALWGDRGYAYALADDMLAHDRAYAFWRVQESNIYDVGA